MKPLFVSQTHGPGKVVRDGVFQEIKARGGHEELVFLKQDEWVPAMIQKVREEVEEIDEAWKKRKAVADDGSPSEKIRATDDMCAEIADAREALRILGGLMGAAEETLDYLESLKRRKRGTFREFYFLREKDIPK